MYVIFCAALGMHSTSWYLVKRSVGSCCSHSLGIPHSCWIFVRICQTQRIHRGDQETLEGWRGLSYLRSQERATRRGLLEGHAVLAREVSLRFNCSIRCPTLLKCPRFVLPTDIISVERTESVHDNLVYTLEIRQYAIRSDVHTARSVICLSCTSWHISIVWLKVRMIHLTYHLLARSCPPYFVVLHSKDSSFCCLRSTASRLRMCTYSIVVVFARNGFC